MKNLKYFCFITVFILLTACSTNKTKSPKVAPRKLSIQELEKQRALETYRLLRLKDRERAKHRKKHFTKIRKRKRVKKPETVVNLPEPAPIVESYPKKDPKEIMIEVEQNLTYFCMKHRRSSRFKEEDSCTLFTQEKLKECQEKHIETDNARLISCVKTRLRL